MAIVEDGPSDVIMIRQVRARTEVSALGDDGEICALLNVGPRPELL